MNVSATSCECCDDVTYHFPLESDCFTYDPMNGLVIHLTEDEMTDLYFELKEYKCGLKEVVNA